MRKYEHFKTEGRAFRGEAHSKVGVYEGFRRPKSEYRKKSDVPDLEGYKCISVTPRDGRNI